MRKLRSGGGKRAVPGGGPWRRFPAAARGHGDASMRGWPSPAAIGEQLTKGGAEGGQEMIGKTAAQASGRIADAVYCGRSAGAI